MTEAFTEILYSVADRVATITLNRPERMNAWSSVMEAETRAAFARAVADDAVRAIVLTATGKGFAWALMFPPLPHAAQNAQPMRG